MTQLDDKQIQGLKRILSLLDPDTLTKEDFVQSFENVVKLVKEIETRNIKEFEDIRAVINQFSTKLKSDSEFSIDTFRKEFTASMRKSMEDMRKEHAAKMDECDMKMMEMKDGEDADEDAIVERVCEKIKIPSLDDLKNDLPVMGGQVRDALELLQGDERLDVSAIKGLEKQGNEIRMVGGARGIQLYVGGAKKGLVQSLNLIAGTGVTLTYNRSNGRNDITFSAAGGNIAVLTATGAVDDSNVNFTFDSTPAMVVVNGATYRDGHGCTISATNVTLDNPVGTGGDIYGIG